MARIKAVVVPQTVAKDGYAVLNAEDDLVYAMAKTLSCHVALFTLDFRNERIRRHCEAGGLAAYLADGYLTLQRGAEEIRVEHVENVPLTYEGKAAFMVQNVLAAVLAAFARYIDLPTIRLALHTFLPSPEQTPGRQAV